MNPTVSVIIPTRDRAALLPEAVESVRAQSWTDWELIVVDDGSVDATPAYLAGLRDDRIRVIRLDPAAGPAAARNAGIAVARGEWVAFLDSDDLWRPEKLEAQLAGLRAHPECAWGYTAVEVVGPDGLPSASAVLPSAHPSGWILEPLLRFECAATLPTLMLRRTILGELGGFDARLAQREDLDLEFRLAARSRALGMEATLTIVRDHAGRTSAGFPPSRLYGFNEAVYHRAELAAATPAIRRLCRLQRSRQLASMTGCLMREGETLQALRGAMRSIALTPARPHGWRALAGWMWRSLGPHA